MFGFDKSHGTASGDDAINWSRIVFRTMVRYESVDHLKEGLPPAFEGSDTGIGSPITQQLSIIVIEYDITREVEARLEQDTFQVPSLCSPAPCLVLAKRDPILTCHVQS